MATLLLSFGDPPPTGAPPPGNLLTVPELVALSQAPAPASAASGIVQAATND